nr:flavin reductase [Trichocoleus sp. FACHB-90]
MCCQSCWNLRGASLVVIYLVDTNQEVNEFVCPVVDETLSHAMAQTGAEFPYGTSEFEMASLKTIPAVDVQPLRIEDLPVAMECKVTQTVSVEGTNNVMVLGQILRFHVREDLYHPDLGLVDELIESCYQ